MKKLLLAIVALVPRFAPVLAAQDDKPIRALLVLGGCCHDYEKQKDIITKGISERANVQWSIAYDPDKGTKHMNPVYENPDWDKGFDVIVHDECSSDVKETDVINRILKPHKEGLPAVLLHCGMHSFRGEGYPKTTAWFEFTGLHTTGHGAQLPIEITFTDKKHPITKGARELDDHQRGALQQHHRQAARHGQAARPRQADQQEQGRQGEDRRLRRRLDQHLQRQDPRLRHDARPQQRNRRRRPLPRW